MNDWTKHLDTLMKGSSLWNMKRSGKGGGDSNWFLDNKGAIDTTIGGLGALTKLLGAFGTFGALDNLDKRLGLQREQFDFAKGLAEKNYANQLKSYNTALEDRVRSRSFTEGRPEGYADRLIDERKLNA